MNILIENPYMEAGGAENRIKMLIEALLRRSDIGQVHFLVGGNMHVHNEQIDKKLHFWQTPKPSVTRLTEQIINDYKIDVVQLHNNQYIGTAGIEKAQEMGIPTVWVMHDFWVLCWQRFLTKVWQATDYENCYKIEPWKCIKCVNYYEYDLTRRQREVINKCDYGVVPSKRIAKIFEDNNVLNGKLKIIDPWIDLNVYHPLPVRKEMFQVFFAGNFIPHKGIQVLLKAWELVNKRLPMAKLLAQGDERCFRETLMMAKALKLQNVSFIKWVKPEELVRIYNESAVTVFPSTWEETAGLIWMESLACGTPVLCSETGSIPELLKYGGEMFPPRDHVALAEKIVDFLLSPSKMNKYAREGREYVNKNFHPDRGAYDFSKMYHELEVKK